MEQNTLTEMLQLVGYTDTNYPEYVKIPEGSYRKEKLDNIYGGFEFRTDYLVKRNYRTGCGLSVKFENCIRHMSYMGIEWCAENDNLVIQCPFRKTGCKQNQPLLANDLAPFCFCACHMSEEYVYDNSLERILKEDEQEKQAKYAAYLEMNKAVCSAHMFYDTVKREWDFRYDPIRCALSCTFAYCPVHGYSLISGKGNIYYDVMVSTKRKDGSMFDGQPIVAIYKGKRFLKRPISLKICQEALPYCEPKIYRREWWNGYSIQKQYDPDLEIAIKNIRACRRDIKNPVQDQKERAQGILVIQEADQIRAEKQQKSRRKQKRLERLEQKIRQQGYDVLMEEEKRLVQKKMSPEKFFKLEQEHAAYGQQLSLAEWMDL